MAKYTTHNILGGTQQNLSSSFKTIVTAIGAASSPRRGKLYDLLFGADGTPADNAIVIDVSRMTADDGTKTNVTPLILDPADAAATTLSRANFTAEGTITATSAQLDAALNARTTFRWVARDGGEILWPATSAAGLALRAKSAAYASTVIGQMWFEEQ